MKIINLDYFTLLSPSPLFIPNVGFVKSPTLRDISDIGYQKYQIYIKTLLMNPETYRSLIEEYSEEKEKNAYANVNKDINFFSIIISDNSIKDTICDALNFFMDNLVMFDETNNFFLLYNKSSNNDNAQLTGTITAENYLEVADIILQRNNIKSNGDEYINAKPKNKIAERLLNKIKNGRKKKLNKGDKKMELANIVSSLASHHNSINILNIWDLTIYQVYDQFCRQRFDDSYKIQSMSIAHWGDSNGKFDDSMWFSTIHEN